jgi:hypothetical protein
MAGKPHDFADTGASKSQSHTFTRAHLCHAPDGAGRRVEAAALAVLLAADDQGAAAGGVGVGVGLMVGKM